MSNLDDTNKEKEKEKNVLPQLNVLVEISIASSVKILKVLSTIILMKNQANVGKKYFFNIFDIYCICFHDN